MLKDQILRWNNLSASGPLYHGRHLVAQKLNNGIVCVNSTLRCPQAKRVANMVRKQLSTIDAPGAGVDVKRCVRYFRKLLAKSDNFTEALGTVREANMYIDAVCTKLPTLRINTPLLRKWERRHKRDLVAWRKSRSTNPCRRPGCGLPQAAKILRDKVYLSGSQYPLRAWGLDKVEHFVPDFKTLLDNMRAGKGRFVSFGYETWVHREYVSIGCKDIYKADLLRVAKELGL